MQVAVLTFSLVAVGLCIFSLASRHFNKLTTDIWEHMVEVRSEAGGTSNHGSRPAGRVRRSSKFLGSSRVGSEGVRSITDRVGSGQEVFKKTHESGRIGLGDPTRPDARVLTGAVNSPANRKCEAGGPRRPTENILFFLLLLPSTSGQIMI